MRAVKHFVFEFVKFFDFGRTLEGTPTCSVIVGILLNKKFLLFFISIDVVRFGIPVKCIRAFEVFFAVVDFSCTGLRNSMFAKSNIIESTSLPFLTGFGLEKEISEINR